MVLLITMKQAHAMCILHSLIRAMRTGSTLATMHACTIANAETKQKPNAAPPQRACHEEKGRAASTKSHIHNRYSDGYTLQHDELPEIGSSSSAMGHCRAPGFASVDSHRQRLRLVAVEMQVTEYI
jgi:hypothetical protein